MLGSKERCDHGCSNQTELQEGRFGGWWWQKLIEGSLKEWDEISDGDGCGNLFKQFHYKQKQRNGATSCGGMMHQEEIFNLGEVTSFLNEDTVRKVSNTKIEMNNSSSNTVREDGLQERAEGSPAIGHQ